MKKKITVILEIEGDDEFMMNDEFIKSDLMSEINFCSNSYDLISIDIEKTQLKTQGEHRMECVYCQYHTADGRCIYFCGCPYK